MTHLLLLLFDFFNLFVVTDGGSPKKVVVDNGREFPNDCFLKMTEAFGINILATAAESPWSNDVVERLNQMIATMIENITEHNKCSHEPAGPCKEALVTRQAVEASGKCSTWWNVKHNDGPSMFIDVDKIDDWQQQMK